MKTSGADSLFRAQIAAKTPLVGAAVGSGISTKHVLAGGADFILAATGGRFRFAGVHSIGAFIAMDNANRFILDFSSREILPRADGKPVIVGVSPNDPTHSWDALLEEIKDNGFHGVSNFPSVGFFDGPFRQALEKGGFALAREAEFMARAAALGLFTMAFAYRPGDAKLMAGAGIHAVCATLEFPAGSNQPEQPVTLDEAADRFAAIFAAAAEAAPDCIRLFYGGGPIASPADVDRILRATGADGYVGGSIFERIPAARAVEEMTGQYKKIISLSHENQALRRELRRKKGFDEIVGQSRVMQDLFEVVNKVADKDVNVLVAGESGTGKELVVKAIHFNSRRRDQPFIKVNCAAIPEALLESELFGHAKGAFTGAVGERVGLFQLADKGTIFLDEIGELSPGMQAKLLRVIQQRELQRVGSDRLIKLDFRLVTATNVDLRARIADGRFREDLYYRLNVVSIHTPALRAHKDDITLLAAYFLKRIAAKFEQSQCRLAPDALEAIQRYDWPGNVRELEHALESASILCVDSLITIRDLPAALRTATAAPPPTARPAHSAPGDPAVAAANCSESLSDAHGDGERGRLLRALAENAWRRDATAKAMGISRKTLYNHMKKHGIAMRDDE